MTTARRARIRAIRTAAAGCLLLLSVVGLSGCSAITDLLSPAEAVRDESGQVVEAGESAATDIEVGDCLAVSTNVEEISEVPVVPCTEPHDMEVYAEFELQGEKFPGDEKVSALADEGCYAAFPDYVGIEYEESTLDYQMYQPLEQGWTELDDRLVSCLLFDPEGRVSESLEGAAR